MKKKDIKKYGLCKLEDTIAIIKEETCGIEYSINTVLNYFTQHRFNFPRSISGSSRLFDIEEVREWARKHKGKVYD